MLQSFVRSISSISFFMVTVRVFRVLFDGGGCCSRGSVGWRWRRRTSAFRLDNIQLVLLSVSLHCEGPLRYSQDPVLVVVDYLVPKYVVQHLVLVVNLSSDSFSAG